MSPVRWLTDAEYRKAGVQERALAWASSYVGKMEEGKNGGPFVAMLLRSVGIGVGNAWCAAFVSWVLVKAGFYGGPKKHRYRVKAWVEWARSKGMVYLNPQRGDLGFWLKPNGAGHIGIVAGVTDDGKVRSIEGNTDGSGSSEGDGVYRRLRKEDWHGFIRWHRPS